MSEELQIETKDLKKTGEFIKKYKIVLLLIIPIFFAIFFRAYSYDLPFTDSMAEDSIERNIKSNIQNQIIPSPGVLYPLLEYLYSEQ